MWRWPQHIQWDRLFLVRQGHPAFTMVVGWHTVRHIGPNHWIGRENQPAQDILALPPPFGLLGNIHQDPGIYEIGNNPRFMSTHHLLAIR